MKILVVLRKQGPILRDISIIDAGHPARKINACGYGFLRSQERP